MTVNAAPVTVIADDQTIAFGGSLPTFTSHNSPAVTLATGATCSSPTANVNQSGTYAIVCTGAADPNYTVSYTAGTLTVNAIPAGQITVSTASLTFLSTTIGQGSSSQVVTVYNSSAANLAVTPSISGDFMVSANGCSVVVAPLGQCNIFVRFVPTTTGARSGQLSVNYAGNGSAPFAVALNGTGGGQVQLSTTSMTFAPLAVNYGSSSQTVNILNLTGAAVTLSVSMSDPNFIVSANNCPATLAANNGCTVYVRFTPKAVGAQNGTLTVTANGSTAGTVGLSGTGTGSLKIDQTALSFAPLAVNWGSTSQTVNISNLTGAAVPLSISMSDPDFIVSANNCPATLAANNGCTVWVRFTPKAAGALNGTLTINAGTVSLSGTGL